MTEQELQARIDALFDAEAGAFTSWLDHHAREDVVGVANLPTSCPLATYAHEKGLDVDVYGEDVFFFDGAPTLPGISLGARGPEWMTWFVACIDELAEAEEVTVSEAYTALGRALECAHISAQNAAAGITV